MDTLKVNALSQFLIGLALLQANGKTYCHREIIEVKTMIEKEIGME